ncbi:tetraspanin-8-like isoform X2 [Mastacembelus armatus]|uniref:tetraspanin-8-like isoform X2 n=1 Tax=Mastacembelus armatus TaxID=205130 RepID=UPI000E45752A|nr:tetraspanin-8-like isoform X2 [Mastacembelus armatus]
MGKVNVCLKWSYIIVTSVIAITSALLLAVTLFSHGYLHEDEEIEKMLTGIHTMYIISIVTLALTILGVFGACKEKKWPLILFAVGMILTSLFMLVCEIHGLVIQPKAEKLKKHYLNVLPRPLNSSETLEGLKDVQMEMQCCGMDQGYLDWGYNIPESCICMEESTNPCVAAPRNTSLFKDSDNDEPIMIYKEPCLQYIIQFAMSAINLALGIMLGVTLLWVLSVVLSIFILCRLNQKVDIPAVVYSPQAKAGNYTVLTDASDLT